MNDLDTAALAIGLLGGLALFLFGMDIVTDALKRVAGSYLKDLLARLTRNRFMGVAVGAVTTAIVNSSSVTTVILVGFISAGLMSMAQSVAVIMGANIGSTVTAQLLAFKVSAIALPAITLGFAVSFLAPRQNLRQYGRMILGFGLVFYGMGVMSDAMEPLRSFTPFLDLLARLDRVWAGVLAGALFTALIQSSAATTGIVIVMAGQGLVSLETAIAIALGANVGTCMTAGLAVIGKPREAVRAAVVHLLFNVTGVLIWLALVPALADLVRWLSPAADHLTGAARAAAEAPRQIANAHTIFNLVNTLLLIGFTTQIARLVEWLVPDRAIAEDDAATPKFLDPYLLSTPAIALEHVRFEIGRMGALVVDLLRAGMAAASADDADSLDDLSARDRPIDALHRAILSYLGTLSGASLSQRDAADVLVLLEIANNLEYIGDRIAINIATSTRKRIRDGVRADPKRVARLNRIHAGVAEALEDAIRCAVRDDHDLAASVLDRKVGLNRLRREIETRSAATLSAKGDNLAAYLREIELVEILDAIFRSARTIAEAVLRDDSEDGEDKAA
jgi:phosphate:Na+ symporter